GEDDRHRDDQQEGEQRGLAASAPPLRAPGERRPVEPHAGRERGVDRVDGHQCTSMRGGCNSRRMSMSRQSTSAAITPTTMRINDSAAPYAYWPFSKARR